MFSIKNNAPKNARPRVVALLDTMWGDGERRAPRYYRINPYNFSGRRLYKLIGGTADLLVTNSCPVMQISARCHGTLDSAYVAENLARLEPFALLLVCGAVARQTYKLSAYAPRSAAVIEMPHPAARTWTKQMLLDTAINIQTHLKDYASHHTSN